MARFRQEGTRRVIEGPGELIVVSDLHGNLRDFLRVHQIFEASDDACLLFLATSIMAPTSHPKIGHPTSINWVTSIMISRQAYSAPI